MSTVIGAMEAYLKLNIDDFEANLEAARKQVASVSSGFDVLTAVGDKMADVGKKLTLGLTTPIIGLGTACVKTTSDFESTMSKVSAISGVTGESLEKLRDKAKEMGAVTKFSAGEAGEAFTYMAMAGWDAEQMIAGISGIIAVVVSLTLAMIDNAELFHWDGTLNLQPVIMPMGIVIISSTAAIFGAVWLVRRLYSTKTFDHIALRQEMKAEEGFTGVVTGLETLVGESVTVFTDMRPSGKVMTKDGKIMEATLKYGGYASKGDVLNVDAAEQGRLYCSRS